MYAYVWDIMLASVKGGTRFFATEGSPRSMIYIGIFVTHLRIGNHIISHTHSIYCLFVCTLRAVSRREDARTATAARIPQKASAPRSLVCVVGVNVGDLCESILIPCNAMFI